MLTTLSVCYSHKYEGERQDVKIKKKIRDNIWPPPQKNSINCSENEIKVTFTDLMGKNPKFESWAAH